jgi:hypothetical protein
MVRQVALFVTTFVVGGFVVYWATASAFGKILNTQPNDTRPRYVRGSNCQIEVAGKIIHLQLGQGVETVDGWRNCQAYEGQSFMVYSTRPPRSVVTARGG